MSERYSIFLGPVVISPSEKNKMPSTRIQAFIVQPATSTPTVASIMPKNIAVSVRIRRVNHATPTTPRMMNNEFALNNTCCGIIGPRGVCSINTRCKLDGSQLKPFAMLVLFTQSAMKFGWRSQS